MTTVRRGARRTGAVLLASGLLCLGAAALPTALSSATAEEELGSGLGSYSLSANAPALQVREDYSAQQCTANPAGPAGCEGVINESVSSLTSGPVGHGLASVAWPGTLAGNLGTLLITLGAGQVPPEAKALNSPIRAEARIGGKNPVVTDYPPAPAPPIAHMKADASAEKVTAEAWLGGAQNATVGTLGSSTSRTTSELTGVSAARAIAHSEVHDVTIAGVLHLNGVVSDAVATTDGTTAKASGKTVVTGATVGGFPVSIDENGITVVTQNVPFPKQATDAVNAALTQAGITVRLSEPHGTPTGGSVDYDAGSLVVVWDQQPGAALSAVLGGAQVSVRSTAGFGCLFNCTPDGTTGGTTGGTFGTTGATPPLAGSVDPAPLPGTDLPPAPVTGPGPQVVQPETRAFSGKLPTGLSPWLGGLAVVGAFLTMAGMRRLPDRVLVVSPTSCPNGETS
ncbi:MAG TPA: hypothetical protein VM097_04695 [Mycobacteriales bacterium]|nr:hypothetical protein [Mycobacteriales bacterium]